MTRIEEREVVVAEDRQRPEGDAIKSKGSTWHRFAIGFCTWAVPLGIVISAYVLILTGTAWPTIVAITVSATLYAELLLTVLPTDVDNEWSRAEACRSRTFDFYSNAVLAIGIYGAIALGGDVSTLSRLLLSFIVGVLAVLLANLFLAILFRQPMNVLWRRRALR